MKKISIIPILCALLALSACRSTEFNPQNGVRVQLDIQAEIIKSDSSKAGKLFEKTYVLSLRDTFVKRYNIDPAKLDSFYVNSLTVSFNQDRCKQLQTYEVSSTFPVIGPYTIKDVCDLTLIGGRPSIISFNANQSTPFSQQLITTNFAKDLKQGSPINLRFKMIPKQDFAEAFGVIILISTRATYRP
jgi:hypothetical protein